MFAKLAAVNKQPFKMYVKEYLDALSICTFGYFKVVCAICSMRFCAAEFDNFIAVLTSTFIAVQINVDSRKAIVNWIMIIDQS